MSDRRVHYERAARATGRTLKELAALNPDEVEGFATDEGYLTREEAYKADKSRGGAAQADDANALTPEDRDALISWYHGVVEDRAYQGRTHYNMPPVRGMAPPGSFRIPKDVFAALGQGDLKVGGAVVHSMFGIEDDPEDPTIVHPHAVRIIGNGSLAAGRRVLERFVARVRRGEDHHGWRAEESEDGVVLHHRRSGNG
jgi:hypothetical protein